MIFDENFKSRFYGRVNSGNDDDCWNWTGIKNKNGYGKISYNGHYIYAHRAAFFLYNGHAPECVCHSCDNRLCCNPKHLIGGVFKDNVRDMVNKGRGLRGEKNGKALLNEKEVSQIKYLINFGFPKREIADAFKVSRSTLSAIGKGKTWKHVGANPNP